MRWTARIRTIAIFVVTVTALTTLAARAAEPNSGQPGSRCVGHDGGLRFTSPTGGESSSALGPNAPAYYEVGKPTGSFAGKSPKGEMLIIHGGAWHMVGKAIVAIERRNANRWRARGWETVNVDYHACARSMADVRWFKNRVRVLHPNSTICAEGISAGGQLALMLAATANDIDCVISLGGPADLRAIAKQTAFDPSTGGYSTAGPARIANFALAAFGSGIDGVNPRAAASAITARLLLASDAHDPLIPVAQNAAMAAAVRAAHPKGYVDVDVLPPGSTKWVHGGTTPEALADFYRREEALVAPLTKPLLPPLLRWL
jgi:acetyl esterase/lipase